MRSRSRAVCIVAACACAAWFPDIGLAQDPPAQSSFDDSPDPVAQFWPHKRVQDMSEDELRLYIAWLPRNVPTAAERVAHAARQSLHQPYREGADLFTHQESDCLSLAEHVLATGLAPSPDSYPRLLARLRYADGRPDLLNQNHFIIWQWDRSNSWCLEDITTQLGQGEIKPWIPLHHIVRRKAFFANRGRQVDLPDVKVIDAFIPREAVPEIMPELRSGDIVNVIVGDWSDRFCDHMGVITLEPERQSPYGDVHIIHSCDPYVRREPLNMFLIEFPRVQGFKFLRLRPDAPQAAEREDQFMIDRGLDAPQTATHAK